MNKKKIIIIVSIAIFLLVIGILIFVISSINKGTVQSELKTRIEELKSGLNYINNDTIRNSGVINVTAKYKGAHGEHYPRESVYNFQTETVEDKYIVTIGNEDGYYKKEYQLPLFNLYKKLSNITIENIKYKKVEDKYELEIPELKEVFGGYYGKCFLIINTEGIIKKVTTTEIKCNDIKIEFKENKSTITQGNNKIVIDVTKQGYALNINDTLRMNAFLNEETKRYNIVLGSDVFYIESKDNKLRLDASSAKAIYNAMELNISYEEKVVEQITEVQEIDIPIFRYYNEYNFDYWRN